MREVDRFSHLQNALKALVQDRKAGHTRQEIVSHLPQQTNKKYNKQGSRYEWSDIAYASLQWNGQSLQAAWFRTACKLPSRALARP